MAVGRVHCAQGVHLGAQQISRILRERFAPGASDAVYKEVAKFMNFKCADQTMEVCLMELDVFRDKAEARMAMGSGFPDEFASAPRARHVAL